MSVIGSGCKPVRGSMLNWFRALNCGSLCRTDGVNEATLRLLPSPRAMM
jgi:hypothetical protein